MKDCLAGVFMGRSAATSHTVKESHRNETAGDLISSSDPPWLYIINGWLVFYYWLIDTNCKSVRVEH